MAETPVVNEPVVAQDTTPTDSAPVENKQPDVAVDDTAAADAEIAKSLASEPETDSPAEVTPAEPVETNSEEQLPAKGYEQRKEQLNQTIESGKEALGIAPNVEIRDLVSAQKAIREAVTAKNAEAYRPATEDELQDQGYSPEMAAIEAFKQEQSIRDYNLQVADKQLELRSEALSIVRDFPDLSPVTLNGEPNPSYNETLGTQLESLLANNLQVDPNTGQVIGSNIPPYQIYKLVADAAKASSEAGQLKGQQATEKMLASVDSPTSAAPAKTNQEDNFLSGLLGEK